MTQDACDRLQRRVLFSEAILILYTRRTCFKIPSHLTGSWVQARGRKHSRSMDEAISSPRRLVGKAFEDWLTQKYGGEGAFRVDGRDFDGGQGNRWWEAKSGRYWVDHVHDEIGIAKFKSDMGHRLQIAKKHDATFELFSNTPIPQKIKAWLATKGIPCAELLE